MLGHSFFGFPGFINSIDSTKENSMGILEEAAGAFAAVEAAKKLDPNAGILTEGIAAIAGFEGTKEVTNLIEKHEEEKKEEQQG
jgi:hypothetical protein